ECPYRLADIDDVITNTSGGVLGWFVGLALRRVLPDPTPHREADPGPPSPMRQAVGVLLDVQIYLVVQLAVFLTVNPMLQGIIDLNSPYVFEVMVTLVTFTLFAFIPMLRDDRASPGLASVHVAVVRIKDPQQPAALWSVLVRWMVRWLPVSFFGLPALLVILPIEALVSWRTRRHRSIASMLSRTVLVTRESIGREKGRGVNRSEPEPADL
ncbi:MAG TPA: VanZ family protein, partial [Candidatus Nanopelagicales bacterium]|nr:VanZ family protein [Candidatus Nanopelagicales bacterium]